MKQIKESEEKQELIRGNVAVKTKQRRIDAKEVKELDINKHTYFVKLETNPNSGLSWYFNGDKRPRWKFVYKYMTMDAFIQCIEHGNIMFQEPSGWNDQFESRFYKADYSNITTNTNDTPKVFATCFTREKDCEASWKVYANNDKGTKSRCVQVKIDVNALRKQLADSACNCNNHKGSIKGKGVKCGVYEGEVSYIFDEYEISRFHKNVSPFYNLFFKAFDLGHFIGLLLFKRPAYEYEKEVRCFMVPTPNEIRQIKARKSEKLYVDLQWEKLIKLVRCDKNCTESEIRALKTVCEKNNIDLKEKCNKVTKHKERYHIPLKKFDINKMQGPRRIKIDESQGK